MFRARAELRPHEGQDAVGDAAGLEVGLEGGEPLRDLGQGLAELGGLVVVGVEVAGRVHGVPLEEQRRPMPWLPFAVLSRKFGPCVGR